MFDLMLGPCGSTYWEGARAMPRSRFHMDWSRVAFTNAAWIDELHAFSYAIGDQQPAAITAAIGATQADIFDTSISTRDAVSKTCLLTHMGVTHDRVALVNAADIVQTLAATRVAMPRLMIRLFYGERTNEETAGTLEDFPEGIGMRFLDTTNAAPYTAGYNGDSQMDAIKPIPKPLPCKGGETFIRVTFQPSVRDGGVTFATINSFTTRLYGVAPAKTQPNEAQKVRLQALGAIAPGA